MQPTYWSSRQGQSRLISNPALFVTQCHLCIALGVPASLGKKKSRDEGFNAIWMNSLSPETYLAVFKRFALRGLGNVSNLSGCPSCVAVSDLMKMEVPLVGPRSPSFLGGFKKHLVLSKLHELSLECRGCASDHKSENTGLENVASGHGTGTRSLGGADVGYGSSFAEGNHRDEKITGTEAHKSKPEELTRGICPHVPGLCDESTFGDLFMSTSLNVKHDRDGSFKLTDNEVNYPLLKQWLEACSEMHQDCFAEFHQDLYKIFLIDVENRVLVPYPPNDTVSYLALSYVWGGVYQPPVKPGPLPRMAQTVEDAMTVTRNLGIRYLWVDSACIDQADNAHLQTSLRIMHRIYTGATATIVDLYGTSAESGLSGVSLKERKPPACFEFREFMLVSEAAPLDKQIVYAPWSKRAWTLQEGLFSNRKIFFARDCVYFVCRGEADEAQGDFKKFKRESLLADQTYDDMRLSCIRRWTLDPHKVFANLIFNYTACSLTLESDVLNAVSGLFSKLQLWSFTKGFHYGLPLHDFPNYLLWDIRAQHAERRPNFPSWSWAGWRLGRGTEPLWDCLKENYVPQGLTITAGGAEVFPLAEHDATSRRPSYNCSFYTSEVSVPFTEEEDNDEDPIFHELRIFMETSLPYTSLARSPSDPTTLIRPYQTQEEMGQLLLVKGPVYQFPTVNLELSVPGKYRFHGEMSSFNFNREYHADTVYLDLYDNSDAEIRTRRRLPERREKYECLILRVEADKDYAYFKGILIEWAEKRGVRAALAFRTGSVWMRFTKEELPLDRLARWCDARMTEFWLG